MVQKVKTNSSNELFNNLNDESRAYDIEANVNVADGNVTNVDSGNVRKNGFQVANFNWWGENHLNIVYQGVNVEERNAINEAVDAFINEVKESVKA